MSGYVPNGRSRAVDPLVAVRRRHWPGTVDSAVSSAAAVTVSLACRPCRSWPVAPVRARRRRARGPARPLRPRRGGPRRGTTRAGPTGDRRRVLRRGAGSTARCSSRPWRSSAGSGRSTTCGSTARACSVRVAEPRPEPALDAIAHMLGAGRFLALSRRCQGAHRPATGPARSSRPASAVAPDLVGCSFGSNTTAGRVRR